MKKVLIFGISGFVGRYLYQEFLEQGYEVYGSDVVKDYSFQNEFRFESANLLDSGAVDALIQGVKPDMIINLAGISSVGLSWSIPQKTMDINVNGTLNIMEAARKCNSIPKVMIIGSSEEYDISDKPIDENAPLNANNPYGISKLAQGRFAEIYRNRYGMKIYYVRPFNHTGVGQKESFVLPSFCKQVAEIEKSNKPGKIYVGNLGAKRDFSDVRDIVRAYRMIVDSEDCERIFNVGSGRAYSIAEILDYIVSLSRQKITIQVDPERFRPVDNPVICCDHSFIKRELGWKPEYNIFDTVKGMFYNYLTHDGY